MVGFGGAGPAHAANVARALGVKEVIVPPASGAASALGFLAAPLSFDGVRSLRVEFRAGFDAAAINGLLGELEKRGARAAAARPASTAADITVERHADMRLVGQMHDISVPLPSGDDHRRRVARHPRRLRRRLLAALHRSVFDGARFEAVTFRVRCAGPEPKLSLSGAVGGGDAARRVKGTPHARCSTSGAVEGDRLRPLRARSRRRASTAPPSSRSARRPR